MLLFLTVTPNTLGHFETVTSKRKKLTVREKTKEDEETANIEEARNTLSEGAQKDA